MGEGRGQDLIGAAHRRREALRAVHDLLDHRAAEQREGAGAHGRAGVMLTGRDHLDGDALVAAEALAIDEGDLQIALCVPVDGAHPAGEIGDRTPRGGFAERAGIRAPCLLPAGDVAGAEALEPVAEAETDEALGPDEAAARLRHPCAGSVIAEPAHHRASASESDAQVPR